MGEREGRYDIRLCAEGRRPYAERFRGTFRFTDSETGDYIIVYPVRLRTGVVRYWVMILDRETGRIKARPRRLEIRYFFSVEKYTRPGEPSWKYLKIEGYTVAHLYFPVEIPPNQDMCTVLDCFGRTLEDRAVDFVATFFNEAIADAMDFQGVLISHKLYHDLGPFDVYVYVDWSHGADVKHHEEFLEPHDCRK